VYRFGINVFYLFGRAPFRLPPPKSTGRAIRL